MPAAEESIPFLLSCNFFITSADCIFSLPPLCQRHPGQVGIYTVQSDIVLSELMMSNTFNVLTKIPVDYSLLRVISLEYCECFRVMKVGIYQSFILAEVNQIADQDRIRIRHDRGY